MLLALKRLFGGATAADGAGPGGRRIHTWVIEPVRLGVVARAQELWRYRRMLWFFSVRAVKARYEGTTLGIFWLFARPLMPIVISTFIFGRLLSVPSEGLPYFLFFLTGVSCWRVFERSLLLVTRSLEQQRGLIKKVYFPRLAAPISSVAPGVAEFLVLFGLFLGAVAYYWWKDGIFYMRLGLPTLAAIGAIALSILTALAVGLWTAIWQVRHKELKYSIRYVLQFWFYVTPVIYPLSTVPEQYQFLLYLNPMAPVVELYKWAMLGIGDFSLPALTVGLGVLGTVLAGGLWYFSHSEAASVDRL
jgi:lipopolysaccharide transport system permease protein